VKISDIRLTPLMTSEDSISAGPGAALIEIETDEELVGIGEACIHSERGEAALAAQKIVDIGFKPLLINEGPFDIHRIWLKLYGYCEWYGRAGVATYVISGIDVALWDIFGKALGVPIHTLLGGRFRDKIPVYASLLFDMDDPDGTAEMGKECVKQGYRAIKYGWGRTRERAFGLDLKSDEKMIRTIRDVLGPDVQIMVDVGRFVNLTKRQAVKLARMLEKYNVFWLEEPLPPEDIDGYVDLSRTVDIYIAAGESEYNLRDFKEYITRRAVDIIQPDVTKAGGFTIARKIVDLCEAWNLMMVPHGFSTVVNVAANLHLVASMPRAFILEYRKTPSPLISRLSKKPLMYEDGCLKIPSDPGLGIEIDYSVVEECKIK
jgi:L-rhamnonate dehydratase